LDGAQFLIAYAGCVQHLPLRGTFLFHRTDLGDELFVHKLAVCVEILFHVARVDVLYLHILAERSRVDAQVFRCCADLPGI